MQSMVYITVDWANDAKLIGNAIWQSPVQISEYYCKSITVTIAINKRYVMYAMIESISIGRKYSIFTAGNHLIMIIFMYHFSLTLSSSSLARRIVLLPVVLQISIQVKLYPNNSRINWKLPVIRMLILHKKDKSMLSQYRFSATNFYCINKWP